MYSRWLSYVNVFVGLFQPEWYFTQILSWLRDHLDFLDQRIQPLLREAGKQQIDSKVSLLHVFCLVKNLVRIERKT